jgi:hypothetical protein
MVEGLLCDGDKPFFIVPAFPYLEQCPIENYVPHFLHYSCITPSFILASTTIKNGEHSFIHRRVSLKKFPADSVLNTK